LRSENTPHTTTAPSSHFFRDFHTYFELGGVEIADVTRDVVRDVMAFGSGGDLFVGHFFEPFLASGA
jgi:hypothetical protein